MLKNTKQTQQQSISIGKLTDFMGTVDVLDIKDAAQAKEQHLGQSWRQLR